jgi:hypothetical protein
MCAPLPAAAQLPIVNDDYQLKMDVDHFNQYRSPEAPTSSSAPEQPHEQSPSRCLTVKERLAASSHSSEVNVSCGVPSIVALIKGAKGWIAPSSPLTVTSA